MPITYLDEEQPRSKITYLDEEETKSLSKQEQYDLKIRKEREETARTPFGRVALNVTDYFFPQILTGKKFAPGKRNIFGDIFERPGAAITSAIFPEKGESRLEAYKRGAVLPEQTPNMQQEVFNRLAPQPMGNKALDYIKAYPAAFVGTAADIYKEPAMLLSMFGFSKYGKQTGKEFGKAKELVKTTVDDIIASPLGETAKRGFVRAVDNIKNIGNIFPKKMNRNWLISQSQKTFDVADDTVKGIQEEYRYLYDKIGIGKTTVEKSEVKNVISDLLRGATKEEADDIINSLKTEMGQELTPDLNTVKKIKDIVQSDIPESVWAKGKKGFDLTPVQARKVKAYFRLKDITEKTLSGTEEGEYLKYLDKKATDVYRLTKVTKRMVLDQTGQPTETGRLVQAFSGKAGQAGKENLFYRLKELNEDAQDIITNMGKFRTRQIVKRVSKKALVYGVAGYGAGKILGGIFGRD